MLQTERSMCGKGVMFQWEAIEHRAAGQGASKVKFDPGRNGRLWWHRRGKKQSFRRKRGSGRPVGVHNKQKQQQLQRPGSRPHRIELRPINLMGSRAPGMRAPRNTNQFLMHEKYQLMHIRTDSVGTESSGGSSDDEIDRMDMDSYLGMLENARGALLDRACPALQPPYLVGFAPAAVSPLHFFSPLSEQAMEAHEESMQYFPSEDDVLKSQNFMEKDFNDFFNRLV